MRSLLFLLFISPGILFCSCKKKCERTEIRFDLSGFDSLELVQIKVRSYVKGGNYTSLRETREFSYWDFDTIPRSELKLNSELDWIVEVPLADRSYKIGNFRYEGDKQGTSIGGLSEVCDDGITYELNGVAESKETKYVYMSEAHYIYLKK